MPKDDVDHNTLPETQSLSAAEKKDVVLKKRAKTSFLGFGCDRTKIEPHQFVRERVWKDLCDESINVSEQRNFVTHGFGSSQEEALKNAKATLGGTLQVMIPSSSAASSISNSTEGATGNQTNKLVCSFVHFDTARCTLTDLPCEEDIKKYGDAFIRSGMLYTGYQVYIEIQMEKQAESQNNLLSVSNQISAADIATLGKFGITKENFDQKLKGKQLASISISSEGVGGYNPKNIDTSKIIIQTVDLASAIKELKNIEEHFSSSLPSLLQRDFIVDRQKDIIEYDELPKRTKLLKQPEESIEDMIENRKMRTLEALGEKIKKELSDDEKKYLDKISLPLLFDKMEIILGRTLQERKKRMNKHRVMDLGRSGAGKSTVLGYVLDYELAPKELSDDSLVLDYLEENEHVDRPKIGHSGSETKGCFLYTRDSYNVSFMDCAGTLDSEGPETDICNAMALSMMIKQKSPDAMMLTIPSSFILDNGRTGFLEIIEQLGKMLPINEKTWSSILLIINDKTPMVNPKTRRLFSREEAKSHILANIQKNINILENEREKLLPETKGFSFKRVLGLKKGDLSEEERRELALLSPDKVERIDNYSSNINKLRFLLKNTDNIIVTDLLDKGETRKAVFKVLDDRQPLYDNDDRLIHSPRTSLSGEDFTPEFLYSEKTSDVKLKFEIILGLIARHFNELMDKQQNGLEKIHRLRVKYAELTNDALVVRRTKLIETEWDKRIQKEKNEQEKLQDELIALGNQIASLSEDVTPSPLPPIASTKTIEPRSFFAVWGGSTYPFEHALKIPYLSVEEKKPESGGEFFPENGNNAEAGIYKSFYRPAWHNYQDSSAARVIVTVRKKDDPHTAITIQELKDKQKALHERINELEINMKGLIARKKIDAEGTAREAEEERKRQLSETKKALNKEIMECRERVLEMRAYSIFCEEVGEIISAFELDTKSVQPEQRERFDKFLKYVKQYLKSLSDPGDGFGDTPTDGSDLSDEDKPDDLTKKLMNAAALTGQAIVSAPFFFKGFRNQTPESTAKKTEYRSHSATATVSPISVPYKHNTSSTVLPFFNQTMVSRASRLKLGGALAVTSGLVGSYFYNRWNNASKQESASPVVPQRTIKL